MTFSRFQTLTLACAALGAFLAAQTPPAKKFKDDKETTEAVDANNEKDLKAKLEKVDKWKHDYPETEYELERLNLYFSTYAGLKMWHEQIKTCQELLKKLPDNFQALRSILVAFSQISSPTDEDRQAATDAAKTMVDHADSVFAADKAKENGMNDDQWKQIRPAMVPFAKDQIDKIITDQGPDVVTAALKSDPSRVTLDVWLGQQVLDDVKKHPDHADRQGEMIFYYARAAVYSGPGALDDKKRAQMKSFVDKAYKTFHGSMDGEDKLLEVAAKQPLPDGFKIESNIDILKKTNAAEAEWRQGHPMLASWRDTKAVLVADDGQAKFDGEIKDSALPKFTGKIVSMTPPNRPKSIVVVVDDEKDGKTGDCKLTFEAALPGNMEPGETLSFEGVAKAFTKEPYMLTLEVEKDKLEGWKGKNAPPARPVQKKKTTP